MSVLKQNLQLKIVSQEKQLFDGTIESLTAQTTQGEITVLPGHVPLFATLDAGELVYQQDGQNHFVVVSKGFIDVGPQNSITVMVDIAVSARDISVKKAQEAIEQAHQTMQNSTDRQELLMAEASLKLAMLELKVAQKTKKSTI